MQLKVFYSNTLMFFKILFLQIYDVTLEDLLVLVSQFLFIYVN